MHANVTGAVALAFAAFLSTSCGRSSPDAVGATSSASHVDAGTLALGERITEPLVALSDLSAHTSDYSDRVVATSGKVTAVCQEMGCWMQLEDASGKAHVRMHGHSFFIPKTASGHTARVQARVLAPKGKGGNEDCEEGNGGGTARIELDATGVELD